MCRESLLSAPYQSEPEDFLSPFQPAEDTFLSEHRHRTAVQK